MSPAVHQIAAQLHGPLGRVGTIESGDDAQPVVIKLDVPPNADAPEWLREFNDSLQQINDDIRMGRQFVDAKGRSYIVRDVNDKAAISALGNAVQYVSDGRVRAISQ